MKILVILFVNCMENDPDMKHALIILLLFVPAVLQSQTHDDDNRSRVALVIGNGDYLSGPLMNTVNDARSVARALRSAGFDVMLRENLSNKDEMKRVIREFGMKLRSGGVGLFYYAGHGMQVNGFNYIIPVNAVINIEEEVEYEAVDVGFVLAYLENAKNSVNIVILDACRNNPFARSFRDASQGLVGMTAPTGTLIAYATAPGSVASDGDGVNGLYTQELLKQINTPGLRVEDVFKNVRKNVLDQSGGRQTPWESSSLIGDFYFFPGTSSVASSGMIELKGLQDKPGDPPGQDRMEDQSGKEQTTEHTTEGRPTDFSDTHSGVIAKNQGSIMPDLTSRQPMHPIAFRWKAQPDGTYFLEVEGKDISNATTFEVRGDHLYVCHEPSGRLFVLKSFIYRMDGIWRKGKSK